MKRLLSKFLLASLIGLTISSCVSNKKYTESQNSLQKARQDAEKCNRALANEIARFENTMTLREEQMNDLRTQLSEAKAIREQQFNQVGDLTVLSKAANDNIRETLSQLEKKDKYIQYLNAARSKTDSINLALAINLKSVLKDGISDEDIDIKVDKTVVFINLSDKMLYQSGSFNLTKRAHEVLAKIAAIIEEREDIDVMVEGYTDNVPIKTACIDDNWDLSVKRATSVVRVLQNQYSVNPNKLIAAGRGEYNTLSTNETEQGRSINRRTRIIILPKINQFYDLLNPTNVPN